MTATNHALTGTAIGLLIGNPSVALPAALASHYVCDAIPHFGMQDTNNAHLKTGGFARYLIVEATVCGLIVLLLMIRRPEHWWLAALCAFAAASPDLLWIPRYIAAHRRKNWRPSWHSRFAGGIQWFQRPIGAAVEVAWLIAAVAIVSRFW